MTPADWHAPRRLRRDLGPPRLTAVERAALLLAVAAVLVGLLA